MIELTNLTKVYGAGTASVKALTDISLTVNQGEFVAVMGTSGSGKSTLLNIIGCLDTAFALGATPKKIIWEVSEEILFCSLQGGYLGIVIAGFTNTMINRYVGKYWAAFNITTALLGIVLASVVGWITSLIPARKAAKIDPVSALRQER